MSNGKRGGENGGAESRICYAYEINTVEYCVSETRLPTGERRAGK